MLKNKKRYVNTKMRNEMEVVRTGWNRLEQDVATKDSH